MTVKMYLFCIQTTRLHSDSISQGFSLRSRKYHEDLRPNEFIIPRLEGLSNSSFVNLCARRTMHGASGGTPKRSEQRRNEGDGEMMK